MNPLLQEALLSILRWLMAGAASYLVTRGVWTSENASVYVGAAAIGLLSLGWGVWEKYRSRQKLVTAMGAPTRMTEHEVEAQINNPDVVTPSVATPKNVVPAPPTDK